MKPKAPMKSTFKWSKLVVCALALPACYTTTVSSGKPAEAETAFREVLKHFPASGRALYGIETSLRQQGNDAEARKVQRQFKKAWKYADTEPDLSWF